MILQSIKSMSNESIDVNNFLIKLNIETHQNIQGMVMILDLLLLILETREGRNNTRLKS